MRNGGQHLCLWQNPSQVRTGSKAITAEKLHLTPMISRTQDIVTATSSGSRPNGIELGKVSINDEEVWFLLPPPNLQLKEDPPNIFADAKNPTARSAYWWVGVGDKKNANMEVGFKNLLGDQLQVPVLTNPNDIKPFTQLCKPQTKKRKTA